MLIAQVEQLLDQRYMYYQFGGERRAAAMFAAWARPGVLNRCGKRRKVDMLLQHR